MTRPRTVPPAVVAPTHLHPEGLPCVTMVDTAIHTVGLPEGHFTSIVMARGDMAVIAFLDHDEVDEHVRLLRNAVEDAKLLDQGLPAIHALGSDVPDAKPQPDYETAWREFSDRLGWLQDNRAVPARYLGRHLADIANDLIDRAYPGLRAGKAPFPEGRS